MNLKGVLQTKATERGLVRGPVDKLTFIKLNTRRPLSPLPPFFFGGGGSKILALECYTLSSRVNKVYWLIDWLIEQYFPVVLFLVLYKVVLTFDSVDEPYGVSLKWKPLNRVVFCGVVYRAVPRSSSGAFVSNDEMRAC